MYNSLYVILIPIILLLDHIHARFSSRHCLIHLRHQQPSVGQYLLGIEHSIDNEQVCEHRCTINHLCSMATFNRQSHRCHLFQYNQKHSLFKPYRSNHLYSTFANCPDRFSSLNIRQPRESNVHCIYDSLLWQRAQSSVIFKSYTLIGSSDLPCQELCSSVRHCAGVQFQKRGLHSNRCRLLHSTKPWELVPSKTWTVFAKRSCHIQIRPNDLFSQDYHPPLCNFKYFGEGQHKQSKEIIHTFPHTSKIRCQYLCSKMVHCIGVELIERRSQCILLSSNFLRNDGLMNIKHQHRHHIYMKVSCTLSIPDKSLLKCSLNDLNCACHRNPCQHGTCVSRRSEGYQYMFCNCHHGFIGDLCDQQVLT